MVYDNREQYIQHSTTTIVSNRKLKETSADERGKIK